MSEELDPQDEVTTEALLRDLQNIRQYRCTNCGGVICGHEALMSLTMGFKNAPRCWHCLADALGHSREKLRDRLSSFIASRSCYNEGWLWANQEEGVGPGALPSCLWPEQLTGDGKQPQAPELGNGDGSPQSTIDVNYAAEWDAGGMACGDLVLELRIRLHALKPGQIFKVLATDPGAEKDLPSWCRMTGNALLAAYHPIYLIQKKQ
jgi:tRNA 2-thiouridine synthesizing protein A